MNPLLTDSRRQALRSASHWYAVLSGERVSPQQEARWQQGYEQDQDNQWPWQQVETRNQLAVCWRRCQPGVARYPPHPPSRDESYCCCSALAEAGSSGSRKPAKVCGQIAAKGTVSRQQLEDGSLLTLNTQSAADVRFDAHQHTVRLWYGEIAITTRKMPCNAPSVSHPSGQLTGDRVPSASRIISRSLTCSSTLWKCFSPVPRAKRIVW